MAAVYLVRDPDLARLVAVKVIHRDLALRNDVIARFFKEAKTAARVQNPHVIGILDFGYAGLGPYLVMEFIDGLSLQKIMGQLNGAALDPIVAVALVCQAAYGLSAATECGVIHRDLKPDNLLISQKGILKITDFGICHLVDHTMTQTGQRLGSPRFMSPEQVKGEKPITAQADMFSLGAVLYYLLSGKAPFPAESAPDLYRQITYEAHIPLHKHKPGLDYFLKRLVDTLLEKDPANRGQGPRWLHFQLSQYLHQKRVVDSAALVAAFIGTLSARGIQTTCGLDAAEIKRLEGSFELEKGPQKPRKIGLMVYLALAVLVGASATWFGMKLRIRKPEEPRLLSTEITSLKNPLATATPLEPHPEAATHLFATKNPTLEQAIPELRPPESMREKESAPENGQKAGISILSIISAPPFAEVALDGKPWGRTPIEGRSIPAGRYHMTLKSSFGVQVDTVLSLVPPLGSGQTVRLTSPEMGRRNGQNETEISESSGNRASAQPTWLAFDSRHFGGDGGAESYLVRLAFK